MQGQTANTRIIVMPQQSHHNQQTERPVAKRKRMTRGDYIVICARQSLLGAGETNLPNDFLELTDGILDGRWHSPLFQAALDLAGELFGEYPRRDTGEQLYEVKDLSLAESAIAARMDLTPAEKIELIRPLREKRRTSSEAAQERYDSRPSKCELEYRQWDEERIASAVEETMKVSADDRSLAAEMRISLN